MMPISSSVSNDDPRPGEKPEELCGKSVVKSVELCVEFSSCVGNFQEGEEECPMVPPSDRHRPGMSWQPRRPASLQSAAPDELASAPARRSAGQLMWERQLIRIAALHARCPWAC